MKYFIFVFLFLCVGCLEPQEVTQSPENDPSTITVGCFGFDWCVQLDEPYRLLTWQATGDVTFYGLDCEPSITYFSSDYYDYIYDTDLTSFEAQITDAGLQDEVDDFLLLNGTHSCDW